MTVYCYKLVLSVLLDRSYWETIDWDDLKSHPQENTSRIGGPGTFSFGVMAVLLDIKKSPSQEIQNLSTTSLFLVSTQSE